LLFIVKRIKNGLSNEANILSMLKSKNKDIQMKAAIDFNLYLLNELKKVKKDDDLTFLDRLMPKIKDLANENNQDLTDKYSCIYIIASIINLDRINFKIRKKHKKNIIQWLKNLLVNTESNLIHMAARTMGKFVENGGIDCDSEYKSSIDAFRYQSKRLQNIILVKELTLAYPSRFFLFQNQYFQIIMDMMCDRSLDTRCETTLLFRLTLMLSIGREMNRKAHRIHQLSTSSSTDSFLHQSTKQEKSNSPETSLDKFKKCLEISLQELESLWNELEYSNSIDKYHKMHGYLLIILEFLRFTNLTFEKTIENYLLTYSCNDQKANVIRYNAEINDVRFLANNFLHQFQLYLA